MSRVQNGAAAETWVTEVGGIGKATAPTAVDADDAVEAWFDLNGRLHVTGDASAAAMPVGPISAGTNNIGDVDILTIAAGETHIGEVSANAATLTQSVTLTVGATYASGDFVGTSGSPISFTGAARVSGSGGIIRSLAISDPAASAAVALELWLFSATVTPPADSAAWDLSDAGGLLCVGVISIPTTAQFLSSATGVMSVNDINLKYSCAATTLFGALVTRGAPTYTGTLQVQLQVERY